VLYRLPAIPAWKDTTFYKKLLILYCLLVTLLVGCFYSASYFTSRETLDLKTKDYMNHIGDLISLKIWRSIDELDNTIQSALFDMYMNELLGTYNEGEDADRQTTLQYISGKVNQLISLNPYVEAVDFYFYNGDLWISPASKPIPDVFKSPYFYINNLNQKLDWVVFEKANNTINGSKIVMDSKRRAVALMVVKINRKFLTDVLNQDDLTASMDYVLTNQEGVILSSTDPGQLGEMWRPARSGSYIHTERTVTVLQWNLQLQAPKVTFSAYVLEYGKSQIVLTLVILILGFMTSLAMARSISKPINRLARQMRTVGATELNMPGAPVTTNEIAFLENSFEHMVRRIDELINKVYKETIFRRESELKALQAQINPHFLFNVLDLLNWKALMAKQEEISEVVQSLSRLLEANMRMDEKMVTVSQEAAYVRDYFKIMSKKFGGRIRLIEDLDSRSVELPIPKLLLQPLVENAIKHGFRYIDAGEIRIQSVVSADRLMIRVEDNGHGIPPDRLHDVLDAIRSHPSLSSWESELPAGGRERTGVGLVNIARRLQAIYGEDSHLQVKSIEGKGTVVALDLPIREREEA